MMIVAFGPFGRSSEQASLDSSFFGSLKLFRRPASFSPVSGEFSPVGSFSAGQQFCQLAASSAAGAFLPVGSFLASQQACSRRPAVFSPVGSFFTDRQLFR
jgi:hypothetical protein